MIGEGRSAVVSTVTTFCIAGCRCVAPGVLLSGGVEVVCRGGGGGGGTADALAGGGGGDAGRGIPLTLGRGCGMAAGADTGAETGGAVGITGASAPMTAMERCGWLTRPSTKH